MRTITFFGDFAPIGRDVEDASAFWRPFMDLRQTLRDGGILIANLEAPLTMETRGQPFKWANLRADPSVASVLEGLDGAIVANNHISDFGPAGARDTLEQLSQRGIKHVGYGKDAAAAAEPLVVQLENGSLSILAFCCPTTNGENLATHLSEGVPAIGMETLERAIRRAKAECDALVVYLHWGCEWVHDPVPDQLRLARHAIECGADAVVGCHSHTIQSYEQYRGRWIFYGLGNLFFGEGVATEVMPGGTVRVHPLRSASANRESLAVTFSIQPDTGCGTLALEALRFFRQSGPTGIQEIREDGLSFDLRLHNRVVATYVRNNPLTVQRRDEVVFYTKLRNGVLAYWYTSDPIGPARRNGLSRALFASAKGVAKPIVPSQAYHAVVQRLRTWRSRTYRKVLDVGIRLKWARDKRHLPLMLAHWELYSIIHKRLFAELGEFPNLVNPRDFNDRIQWLKLFDQTEEQIRCSDKIRVRDYVRNQVGGRYLVDLYQVCDRFDEIDFERLPNSFVIKTNHDSGTAILVRDKTRMDVGFARARIQNSLKKVYGWENGEWAYAFIEPKILVEQFIGDPKGPAPPDFKFYVVDGKVKFMHYISDRGANTKEQTVCSEGKDLGISLYPSFELARSFVKPACWEEMKQIAQRLGEGFKCVRVDLFEHSGRVFAGEMTFWPMYGCYKGDGQKRLGPLLDFDRTTFTPPIYHQLRRFNAIT